MNAYPLVFHKSQIIDRLNLDKQAIKQKIIDVTNNEQFEEIFELQGQAINVVKLLEASNKKLQQILTRETSEHDKRDKLNAEIIATEELINNLNIDQDKDRDELRGKSNILAKFSANKKILDEDIEKSNHERESLIDKIQEHEGQEEEKTQAPAHFTKVELDRVRSLMKHKHSFGSLFKSKDQQLLAELNKGKVYFDFSSGGLHYLDISPDIERLLNESHFDSYGKNIINIIRTSLERDPDYIKSVRITNSSSKNFDLNRQELKLNFPSYGQDPVINYLADWIRYGFGQLAKKPGIYTRDYGVSQQATASNNVLGSPSSRINPALPRASSNDR